MAAKFEIRSPKAGEFNWVLLSQGRTLATGETYTRKVSCVNALESVRKAAPTAAVDDTTVKPATARAKTAKTARTAKTAGRTVAARAAKKAAKKAAGAAVGGVATKVAAGAAKTTATAAAKTGRAAGKVAAGAARKAAPRKRTARGS
jgi:uncharacterized protein YegP (UPF0339 family)